MGIIFLVFQIVFDIFAIIGYMRLTAKLDDTIEHAEQVANDYEDMTDDYALDSEKLHKCANEHRQLAEWLKILKAAQFEYYEAWQIITHPTLDVTYADKERAKTILDTFKDSLGRLYEPERRTDE